MRSDVVEGSCIGGEAHKTPAVLIEAAAWATSGVESRLCGKASGKVGRRGSCWS